MKDYNTITAELLKNAPHGIDCYVSNVSYADALQDIHCIGDAVRRVIDCRQLLCGTWQFSNTVGGESKRFVIPVHLAVKELVSGCIDLYNRIDSYHDEKPRDVLLFDFIDKIVEVATCSV